MSIMSSKINLNAVEKRLHRLEHSHFSDEYEGDGYEEALKNCVDNMGGVMDWGDGIKQNIAVNDGEIKLGVVMV